ncbi:MAG: transposase [Nitrosomonas sp.]|nr:transposase [Nitrosomonas sp.]
MWKLASVTRYENPNPKKTRNKPATKIDMIALARDVQEAFRRLSSRTGSSTGCQRKGIGHALRRKGVSYKNTAHPKADEDKRHIPGDD